MTPPVRRPSLIALTLLPILVGCGHVPLSASELNTVARPAFVARLELDAGPRSTVFRDLSSQAARLQGLAPAEGDRRLAAKLAQGASPFEVAERLRIGVVRRLPQTTPWTYTVPASEVSAVLQSLLVEERPQRRPDVRQLDRLGADTLIELIVERYGMQGEGGAPGIYVSGRARLTRLNSGATYYARAFSYRMPSSEEFPLDPLVIAREPRLFGDALSKLLDEAAELIAQDLQPRGRSTVAPARPTTSPSLDDETDSLPRDTQQAPAELPDGELPRP